MDVVGREWVRWFWGLTCDFWAKNAKNKNRQRQKAVKSVASPFGLRSGLRQSGRAFGLAFYGTRKRMPLSKTFSFL
jgi:hypothetical protein